jgi:hypothetical protein
MEFETIDGGSGELPEEYRSYFRGTTEPGDIDWDVDEGDWADGY